MKGRLGCLAWFGTPAALLLWLAPACHELLTGSKPPSAWFQPQVLLVAVLVYGCGALVAHELAQRRFEADPSRRFWPRLAYYAAANGVLVDGLMLRNYINGDWVRLGRLADTGHGHVMGLNLTWMVLAIATHVGLGVLLPVLLIELWQPAARGRAWLAARGRKVVGWLFYAPVVFGFLASGELGFGEPMLFVCFLAWFLHRRGWQGWPGREREGHTRRPWRIGVGLALLTSLLAAMPLLATRSAPGGFPWPRVMTTFLLLWLLLVWYARVLGWRALAGWSDRHSLAAVSGVLLPYALLAFVQAGDTYHSEAPQGMALVGLGTLWGMWLLRRRVRRRATVEPDAQSQYFPVLPEDLPDL